MVLFNKDLPHPPLAAGAEAETARLNTQVLDVGTTEKDIVAENAKEGEKNEVTKKQSDAGLKNYFVSDARIKTAQC